MVFKKKDLSANTAAKCKSGIKRMIGTGNKKGMIIMGKYSQKLIGSIFRFCKKWALTFSAGFIFALLCFVALNAAMKPVSKSEYCGTKCHEMDTAYQSWKLTAHGANKRGLRVECVSCHAPSKEDYFTHLAFKAYAGGKDMYKHYFGDEYDVEEFSEVFIYLII